MTRESHLYCEPLDEICINLQDCQMSLPKANLINMTMCCYWFNLFYYSLSLSISRDVFVLFFFLINNFFFFFLWFRGFSPPPLLVVRPLKKLKKLFNVRFPLVYDWSCNEPDFNIDIMVMLLMIMFDVDVDEFYINSFYFRRLEN